MARTPLFFVTSLAVCVTYVVVVLGAYVRLTDAGLGCPDWPGCYGELIVPPAGQAEEINAAFPGRPYDQGKAWREMTHRYGGAGLGVIVLGITLLSLFAYRQYLGLSFSILALVILQGALGMWTVTLLLKPVIVSAHLMGGMAVLSLLFLLLLRQLRFARPGLSGLQPVKPYALLMLALLALQIFLGGWTGSNYAALICPDFPACRNGAWLPPMDFAAGFTFWRELGINYEGGVLDAAGRTAIHVTHRLGALIVLGVGLLLAFRLLQTRVPGARCAAMIMVLILVLQIVLGISNVVLMLPLSLAVAHNAVGTLLLLSVVTITYLSFEARD